jgi:hypothetical protein
VVTGDDDVRSRVIHGQEVFLPTADEWYRLAAVGRFRGRTIPPGGRLPELARRLAGHADAVLGLTAWADRWLAVPLVRLGSEFWRVQFEDVLCEHCSRRAGLSATPDRSLYAGTSVDPRTLEESLRRMPVRHCPHCGAPLRRRQTLWLAGDAGAPPPRS